MQIKLKLIKDNGEEVDYFRELGDLDSTNILKSVEDEVTKIRHELLPLITETAIESHQSGFVGEKNQEEKWD